MTEHVQQLKTKLLQYRESIELPSVADDAGSRNNVLSLFNKHSRRNMIVTGIGYFLLFAITMTVLIYYMLQYVSSSNKQTLVEIAELGGM